MRDFLLPVERWDESVHEEHEIFCRVYYRALLQKESHIIGPICGNRHVVRDLLLPEERWSAGCVYQKHTKRCSVAYIIVHSALHSALLRKESRIIGLMCGNRHSREMERGMSLSEKKKWGVF